MRLCFGGIWREEARKVMHILIFVSKKPMWFTVTHHKSVPALPERQSKLYVVGICEIKVLNFSQEFYF